MSAFISQVRTNVKKVRHINYTCSPELYERLEKVASAHGIGLKELLRQMVDYALYCMETKP